MTEQTQVAEANVDQQVDQAIDEVLQEAPEKAPFVTLLEQYSKTIQEITGCTVEQAEGLTNLTSVVIGEAIDLVMNNQETLQAIFTSMLRVQINNSARLENILNVQQRREFVVVDEPHPVSDLRVHYVESDPSSWVFEQAAAGGWETLTLAEGQSRIHLEVLAGKFFGGRVGHTGYIVEVGSLQRYQANQLANQVEQGSVEEVAQ